jgi:alpha-mannosidase/mannosylglycerate hydrolase
MEVAGRAANGEIPLAAGSDAFKSKARAFIDRELARSDAPVTVIMDAMDHEPLHENTPDYIRVISDMYGGAEVRHTDLKEAFDGVKNSDTVLQTAYGELNRTARIPAPHQHLISNTLSARYGIKQANDRAQSLLENWLEPLSVFWRLNGIDRDADKYIGVAWRWLIQNHAHDSICGCAVDRVHNEMFFRFSQTESIFEALCERNERVMSDGFKIVGAQGGVLNVINPSAKETDGGVVCEIPFAPDFPKWHEPFGYEDINAFRLYDPAGAEIVYTITDAVKNAVKRTAGDGTAACDLVTVKFAARLRPFGVTSFRIVPSDKPVRFPDCLVTPSGGLDNGIIAVSVQDGGTVTLYDRATGINYPDLLGFIDDSEIGDGWFSARALKDRRVISKKPSSVEVVSAGAAFAEIRIRHTLSVPERTEYGARGISRSARYTDLNIDVYVSLFAGARRAVVRIETDNNVRDHRLRLSVPTGIDGDYFVDQAYAFVTRKCGMDPETLDWKETDSAEKAMSAICGKRNADGTGLAVLSQGGLKEVSADGYGNLFITLLRCFSRTYTTNGEDGGQEQGHKSFALSLVPLDASVTDLKLYDAQKYLAAGSRSYVGAAPSYAAPFALAGNAAVSAVKLPYDGTDGCIVRLFNTGGQEGIVHITPDAHFKKAYLTDFTEEKRQPLKIKDGAAAVTLKPFGIVTVRLE